MLDQSERQTLTLCRFNIGPPSTCPMLNRHRVTVSRSDGLVGEMGNTWTKGVHDHLSLVHYSLDRKPAVSSDTLQNRTVCISRKIKGRAENWQCVLGGGGGSKFAFDNISNVKKYNISHIIFTIFLWKLRHFQQESSHTTKT